MTCFQWLSPFDEQSVTRPNACAHHDGSRGGETEGAGTRYTQHGDSELEGVGKDHFQAVTATSGLHERHVDIYFYVENVRRNKTNTADNVTSYWRLISPTCDLLSSNKVRQAFKMSTLGQLYLLLKYLPSNGLMRKNTRQRRLCEKCF